MFDTFPDGPPEGFEEAVSVTAKQLDEITTPLGLYLQGMSVHPSQHEDGKVILMADFILGDLAFSEQTLYPQKFAQNEQARQLFTESEADEANEIREQWKGLLDDED